MPFVASVPMLMREKCVKGVWRSMPQPSDGQNASPAAARLSLR